MGRFLAGVVSALLLVGAGIFIWKSIAQADDPIPPASRPSLLAAPALPGDPPSADLSREEKRFDRYDKDRNGDITRTEYLAPRQKAFGKLDINRDGKLDFEEWAARTTAKFEKADADKSAALNRVEFTTTRVIRTSTPRCSCPQDGGSAD